MVADLRGTITDYVFRGWDDQSLKHFLTVEHNYKWSEASERFLQWARENFNSLESNEV